MLNFEGTCVAVFPVFRNSAKRLILSREKVRTGRVYKPTGLPRLVPKKSPVQFPNHTVQEGVTAGANVSAANDNTMMIQPGYSKHILLCAI